MGREDRRGSDSDAAKWNDFDEAVSSGTAGDIAWLAGGVAAGSLALSGVSAYRNRFDETKGLPPGTDWATAFGGLLIALTMGEYIGEGPALGFLGIGLAGVASITSHGGTLLGDELATMMGAPPAKHARVGGHESGKSGLGQGGIADMSAEERAEYEAYAGR